MRVLLRRLFRCLGLPPGYASGGSLPAYRPRPGERLVVLSDPRPDYAAIDRLERELGMQVEEEQPIVRPDRVCLTKDCQGDTQTVEAWGGQVLFRIHRCAG